MVFVQPMARLMLAGLKDQLKVRDRVRAGLGQLEAVGSVTAATAVVRLQHARVHVAREHHVSCASMWRAMRAVLWLVMDRVRVSPNGSA